MFTIPRVVNIITCFMMPTDYSVLAMKEPANLCEHKVFTSPEYDSNRLRASFNECQEKTC